MNEKEGRKEEREVWGESVTETFDDVMEKSVRGCFMGVWEC